jgi:hypothetical protein
MSALASRNEIAAWSYLLVLPDVVRLVLRGALLVRAAGFAAGVGFFFFPFPLSAKPIPAARTVTAATAAPAITGTEEPFLAAGAGLGACLAGAGTATLGTEGGAGAAGTAAATGAAGVACSLSTTADGASVAGWRGISTGTGCAVDAMVHGIAYDSS